MIFGVLGRIVGGRHHVDIVEAIEGDTELLDEVEALGALGGGCGAVHRAREPGAAERARTEHVVAPFHEKVCQKQTAKRRWSSIRLPITTRSLS